MVRAEGPLPADLDTPGHRAYASLAKIRPELEVAATVYRDFRDGDVLHSLADISDIETNLGYKPATDLETGLDATIRWFVEGAG